MESIAAIAGWQRLQLQQVRTSPNVAATDTEKKKREKSCIQVGISKVGAIYAFMEKHRPPFTHTNPTPSHPSKTGDHSYDSVPNYRSICFDTSV